MTRRGGWGQPCIPLWYEDHVAALRTGIEGYRLAPDGNYDGLLDVRKILH